MDKRLLERAVAHRFRIVLVLMALATAARAVYIAYLGDDIGGPDGPTYDDAGWDLASRGILSSDVTGLPYFPPGYPLLVASHYELFGHHPFAVKVGQLALIPALTWLTFRLAERVAGPAAALVAGAGMSLSLVWLALGHPLMYEPWAALLLVAAVLLLLRADEEHTMWPTLGAGIALGAAAALQDKFLSLLPLVAVWILWRRSGGGRRALAVGALILGAALVVVPLVVRNQVVYGEPLVLATNHGINMVIGNGPDATGGYVSRPSLPPVCFEEARRAPSVARDRGLVSCSAVYAVTHPAHTISLWPAKLARFWAPFVGPRFEEVNWRHFFDWRSAVPDSIRSRPWFHTADVGLSAAWVVAGLGLFLTGAALSLKARPREASLLLLAIAWLVAVHLVTFGDPRFRIPVLPLVWVFQAVALTNLLVRGAARTARS